MGHTYAVEVDSDDIGVCTERLVEFFRDIDSKDVPVIDDSASTYTTVSDRLLETAKGGRTRGVMETVLSGSRTM